MNAHKGDRIRLDFMGPDPDPIAPGATGTVNSDPTRFGSGPWQVSVAWDNGRSLMLACPPDQFTVLQEKEEETA